MIEDIAVSACIIVKNGSKTIADTLDSIKQCYEIVIVDTGSTDNTIDVVKNFNHSNKKLFRKKFNRYFLDGLKFEKVFDFAFARNFSLSKATGNWILVIDADEVLEDYNKLELLIKKYGDKNIAWRFRQITELEGTSEKVKILTTRLWHNELGIHYKNIVHETPDESIAKIGFEFGTAEGIYLKTKQNKIGKAERIIKALKFVDMPYKYFYLAAAYSYLQDYSNHLLNLNLSLQHDKLPPAMLARVYSSLGNYYFVSATENYKIANDYLNKSLEVLPEQNTARLIMHNLKEFRGITNGKFEYIDNNNDFDLNV
jgi:glycosyltransferase involved in cell wall biosynthesis